MPRFWGGVLFKKLELQHADSSQQEKPRLGQPVLRAGPFRRFYSLPVTCAGQGINIKRIFGYPKHSGDNMGKLMVSLSDEAEELVRDEVEKRFFGRTGGVSIFFEGLVRKYFNGHKTEKKPK